VIASNGVNGSSKVCDAKGVCSAGTGIQGEFNLTNFEDGLLSSAFMVGLLVASPIFAGLSKRFNFYQQFHIFVFLFFGVYLRINVLIISVFLYFLADSTLLN
jgi:hypothetical protein